MSTLEPKSIEAQATTSEGVLEAKAEFFQRCLPGDSYLKFPVRARQTVEVHADIKAECDFRGWSWNGGGNWVGPEGQTDPPLRNRGALSSELLIGRLIGKFSTENVEGEMSREQVARIFRGPVWDLGGQGGQFTQAPFDGFLYLRMNDTLDFQNNRGSIQVLVQLGDVF